MNVHQLFQKLPVKPNQSPPKSPPPPKTSTNATKSPPNSKTPTTPPPPPPHRLLRSWTDNTTLGASLLKLWRQLKVEFHRRTVKFLVSGPIHRLLLLLRHLIMPHAVLQLLPTQTLRNKKNEIHML